MRQCKTTTDDTDQGVRRVETRSFPNSLAATLRGFTFYLADPPARLRRFTQIQISKAHHGESVPRRTGTQETRKGISEKEGKGRRGDRAKAGAERVSNALS
jgi:hypothetical protein